MKKYLFLSKCIFFQKDYWKYNLSIPKTRLNTVSLIVEFKITNGMRFQLNQKAKNTFQFEPVLPFIMKQRNRIGSSNIKRQRHSLIYLVGQLWWDIISLFCDKIIIYKRWIQFFIRSKTEKNYQYLKFLGKWYICIIIHIISTIWKFIHVNLFIFIFLGPQMSSCCSLEIFA